MTKTGNGLADPPGILERIGDAFSAIMGKKKSVPNFNPYFMTPSQQLGGGLIGNSVQQYPGMFHPIVYGCCRAIYSYIYGRCQIKI